VDDRSAIARLADAHANHAALAAEGTESVTQMAHNLWEQVPGLEREAARERAEIRQREADRDHGRVPDGTVPSLIEQLHPGAVPRFDAEAQRQLHDRTMNVKAISDDFGGGK
jgi:hypothetical protein